MKTYKLVIRKGRLCFVYDDRLKSFAGLGSTKVARVSHVEPTSDLGWTADLSPVGGPCLGPFKTREEALNAEKHWLDANMAAVTERMSNGSA